MLDSLYAKTFAVLGGQLALTWLTTLVLLGVFRRLYWARVRWVSATQALDGSVDLDLDWSVVRNYFWALLAADFAVFLVLRFHGSGNLTLGVPLFCLWSVLTGVELALCLVSVDENLGGRVLALTALVTCLAGLVGAGSGIDFSTLGGGLFAALLALVVAGAWRVLFSMPRWAARLWAALGIVVFNGYLLYDFHRLAALNELNELDAWSPANGWNVALRISISLYLDIINLFLDLLDLLSS